MKIPFIIGDIILPVINQKIDRFTFAGVLIGVGVGYPFLWLVLWYLASTGLSHYVNPKQCDNDAFYVATILTISSTGTFSIWLRRRSVALAMSVAVLSVLWAVAVVLYWFFIAEWAIGPGSFD